MCSVQYLKENSHIACCQWVGQWDTALYSIFYKEEICPAMSSIPLGRLWCLCSLRPYLERKQLFALCQKAIIHHGNSLKGVNLLWTGFVPSLWKFWCLETKSTQLCHKKKKSLWDWKMQRLPRFILTDRYSVKLNLSSLGFFHRQTSLQIAPNYFQICLIEANVCVCVKR